MTSTSVTQATNVVKLTMAVGIIVRIFSDPSSVSAEEWQIVGLSVVGIIATGWSYLNRLKKGDMVGLITKDGSN